MSRYCTAQDVRTFTGLGITDASDLDLDEFLDPATKTLINQITVTRNWELMSYSALDDTVYFTEKYPIADITGDMTIDKDDVVVYEWDDLADSESKTLLTVTSVTASEGKITLSAAPSSNYVTINYRYYPNEMDWDLIKVATALNAGESYAFTKWLWIPDTYQLGPVRIRNIRPVWEKIHDRYVQVLFLIQKRGYAIREPWLKKSLADMDKIWRG